MEQRFDALMAQISEGRTDQVFELVEAGFPANGKDDHGVSLIRHCAYYGDVSAIRFLLRCGEVIKALGENLELNGAAFHGHWRLCQFLLEHGAEVNYAAADTGETALHSAICKTDWMVYDRVVEVLLAHSADPNASTKPEVETGAFMRDCRTKGETPLHRAAAFGGETTIQMLLDAGAFVDARDMHGDTPLSWASWYGRPNSILQLLCYGRYRVRPESGAMRANLIGRPRTRA
jgi:ankyrin repeat protein